LMYNFDNLSSLGENATLVVDASQSGNNGTVIGATWNSSGKYNGAFEFDGDGDYITTPYYGEVRTLSFWFKTNDFKNAHSFFGQRYDSTEESGNWQMHWNSDDDQQIRIQTYNSTITAESNLFNTIFELDKWYYIAVTSDGENINFYVNGTFDSNHDLDVYLGGGTNDDFLYVGGSGENDVYESFNGTIDEVRILNKSLSADEVYQEYTSNLQKFNSTQWYMYINQSKNATDTLDEGNYTYSFYSSDLYSNSNTSNTTSIIVDWTAPVFTNFTNRSFEHANGVEYDINATDVDDISCFIVNDTTRFNINCTGYLTNNTRLAYGVYWVNITINDTASNNNSGEMWINITDTIIILKR